MSHSMSRPPTPRAGVPRLPAAVMMLAVLGCQEQELTTGAAHDAPRFSVATSLTTQNITGVITGGRGSEPATLEGIHVTFFDAFNAEVLGRVKTMEDGSYDSGPLPIGSYRVRFSDDDEIAVPGLYLPEFFGAAGEDVFCSSSVVVLPPATTVVVDQRVIHSGPVAVALFTGALDGHAFDLSTGDVIPGIDVSFRNTANALVVGGTTTGKGGRYDVQLSNVPARAVRIRFSDPAPAHLPAYHGVPGVDLFCDAAVVHVAGSVGNVDGYLRRVPPENLAQDLIDVIDDFELPDDVQAVLVTPLNRLIAILSDDNSNNDAAACAQLRAFLSRVDVQQRRGNLSAAEADELREHTAILWAELGCG